METFRERLAQSSRFLFGVELVSIRGSMAELSAIKAREFGDQLSNFPLVDWISITDNAGGNPQMAPQALAKPILYAGKEVVIHLTCKDLNRNGLESLAWQLSSEGFHNVLAMTGDYPVSGNGGMAKPVFDLDSVALICLLDKMNRGFDQLHEKTQFCIGTVVNNYKMLEGEVMPQLAKLQKKIECGGAFIINQVGYNSRKAHELRLFVDQHIPQPLPLIGNVFLLNAKRARMFNSGKIPGVVVTDQLNDLCQKQGQSRDEGKAFFLELAAKQVAIFRGLGFRGAYIGGVHDVGTVERIIECEKTFAPDDWKQFAREIRFGKPGEYYSYGEDTATGLANPSAPGGTSRLKSARAGFSYGLSKLTHEVMFTPKRALFDLGARVCATSKDTMQGPAVVRLMERAGKSVLYDCKDCGDCSLPDIAFLCPESQCAKNQRNGPCGGTHDGHCEVEGYGDCIWLRAYERLKHDGKESTLLEHSPVVQNQALRGTSSWANNWLGRDHGAVNETHKTDT
ncbi:MAG TPA: methylenetetrahydrofolate reductase C-terminal domain-containing protein [Bacteroidota bacterium]|nr:methylenetetrahydrofolate reductase C-terminal domain-containing protein [Bacteroidota bacterium]